MQYTFKVYSKIVIGTSTTDVFKQNFFLFLNLLKMLLGTLRFELDASPCRAIFWLEKACDCYLSVISWNHQVV